MSKGGRPAFQPTADQRAMVEAMTGYGIPQDEICLLVINPATGKPISEPSLRKHFKSEIKVGAVKLKAKIAESLVMGALGQAKVVEILADGTRRTVQEAVKANPAEKMFFLKCRAGWRETIDHRHAGKDGGPIEHEDVTARKRVDSLLDSLAAAAAEAGGTQETGED